MDDRYEEFSNEAIPYKCTARGGPDELMGKVVDGNVPLEEIKVYTERGATLVTEIQGDQLIIHVAGVEPTEMVYAMAGDTCLGAFYQVAYEATNYKVHLVSVNGAGADIDLEDLEKTVNRTLVQAACLTTIDRSPIALTDTSAIIDAESRLMTIYSTDVCPRRTPYCPPNPVIRPLLRVKKRGKTMEKGIKSRRNAAQMELLVMKWEQSGQSRADFCREEGLPPWIFQYWLSRYRGKQSSELTVGFSEIVVKGEKLGNGLITIRHCDGMEVEIRDNVSASWLRQLLGW